MSRESDFWSRRKARVAAEAEAEAREVALAEKAAQETALEEKSDDEVLAELGLPDPDQMRPGDDFSAFMKVAVPERLRRRALRRLWLSNPALANLDGLIEYGEDYTDAATVVENMQTAYQVGKGMLKHVEELARKEAEKANPKPDVAPESALADDETRPNDTETATDAADPDAATTFVEDVTADETDTMAESDPAPDDTETAPVVRRRLRFAFET